MNIEHITLDRNTIMQSLTTLGRAVALTVLLALAAPGAHAQEMEHQHDTAPRAATAPAGMSTGEVIKVDKATGKITLRHGPLDNLGMGAMTMVFKTAEPMMTERVKPGDKVWFVADMVGGALTITTMQMAQ